MCATPSPATRPGSVTAAFWCWLVAAVLTAALGLMILSIPGGRIIGGLLLLAGLARAFLADRARKGDIRFARAALGLAMASVVFLAVVVLLLGPGVFFLGAIVLVMLLEIVGSAMNQRAASQKWYESQSATGKAP